VVSRKSAEPGAGGAAGAQPLMTIIPLRAGVDHRQPSRKRSSRTCAWGSRRVDRRRCLRRP
jgi:hypothetical protein